VAGRSPSKRLVALDWMRGLVMVLMALDHASVMLNAGRVAEDSAATYIAGAPLPLDQFLTRWVTHLCAPTFVFLAGTALALSAGRRAARGESASTDRDLLVRGTLLILFDAVYMTRISGQTLLLQVLYAIGLSMILMIALRRLDPRVLAGLGAAWFVLGEWVTGQFWTPPAPPPAIATRLLLAPYHGEGVTILYPVIPWLALMAIGYAFGTWLDRRREHPPPIRALSTASLICVLVFVCVRGLDGYGNMFLPRADASLAQWLHVSKYPPSLSFAALELGVLFIGVAGLMWLEPRVTVRDNGPLLVFGQTALFFYLVHFLVLGAIAVGTGSFGKAGLPESYLATLVALAAMYPVCRWFRGYKRRHPRSLARYV